MWMGYWNETKKQNSLVIAIFAILCGFMIPLPASGDELLRSQTQAAFKKAIAFYHGKVAIEGGYVFRYSSDLTEQEGEVTTGKFTVWIEPPATPAVAMIMLEAYQRTGDETCLAAAKQAAECLIRGQLHSGGWSNSIEFEKSERAKYAYRVDGPLREKARNVTTLDDNKTQSAVCFLMRLDQELKFSEARIHEASLYALEALIKAQFPNGGWPQGFSESVKRESYPVLQASYPNSWSRTHPKVDYKGCYTLNDDTHVDTLKLMLTAFEVYGDKRFNASAMSGAEFLLIAQMPDPQPAWAQQYNVEMQPAWARRFEPPSISGGESQNVIAMLLSMYQNTGDKRFLEASNRALQYLEKCVRSDGSLARFYELQTNRPLYFTKDYQLTYDDRDMPTHYGFVVGNGLSKLKERYDSLAAMKAIKLTEYAASKRRSKALERPDEKSVRKVVETIDARGAWIESGKLQAQTSKDSSTKIIDSKTFIKNIDILSRYLRRD